MTVIAARYEVQQKLGEGGMGTVYRGLDTQTRTPVAIKSLKSDVTDNLMIERFIREGEALRQLNHPSIVKMLDAVEENAQHYLVMEYVTGGSLAEWLAHNPCPPIKKVLNIALDLADALTRAHRLNIIHRDLKPANILLAEDGTPRLSDFGIAYMGAGNRTEKDSIVGTIAYLSPEMLQDQATASPLMDIWAFGVVLFEMLAGQRPFDGELYQVMSAIITAPVPDLEKLRPDAPIGLIDLIYRMLAKNPAERIPSVRLIGAELEALLKGTPVTTSTPIQRPTTPVLEMPTQPVEGRFATSTPSAGQHRHNLPIQATAFVGREHELTALAREIGDPNVRLITLLAQGGMGKTRLSIEASHAQLGNFPDGVFFIDLAPLITADDIPNAIGQAVSYTFQQDGRSPQQQLNDYFHAKHQLLIFDNFEHVLDGAGIVGEILKAAPQVKIIATSRERLNLSQETIFTLSGMDFPEWETPADALEYAAVKLFMQSARRVQPGFELKAEDLPYVARICRLVQGMPLAIVLAAAWLEMLSLPEIAAEIAQDIGFLETQQRDIPERQRSIRSIFDYSWQRLDPAEQQVFMRLAVFRGGVTREAAQTVAGANLRSLQTLVNRSLLRREAESGRFTLHELLRQYAEEQLKKAGAWAATAEQHARYFAGFITRREADLKGQRQLAAIQEIDADFENIKVAWHWLLEQQQTELVNGMLESLYWFTTFHSRFVEGAEMFRQARLVWPVTGDHPSALSGRLLIHYPDKYATETFERGLAIAEQHRNAFDMAVSTRLLGHWVSHSTFDQTNGIPLLLKSLAQFRALRDDFYTAMVLDDVGWSYNLAGERDKQLVAIEEALTLRRKMGDQIGVANVLRNMGGAYGGFGISSEKPLQFWSEALQLARQIGDRTSIAWNTMLIGTYWLFRADFARARQFNDEAFAISSDIHHVMVQGMCLLNRGLFASLLDQDYAAAHRYNRAAYPPDIPADMRILTFLISEQIAFAGEGDYRGLAENMRMGIRASATMGDTEVQVMAWFTAMAAFLAAHDQQPEYAAELLGIAFHNAIYEAEIFKDWEGMKQLCDRLTAQLGQDAFNTAFERGKQRPVTPETEAELLRLVEGALERMQGE